MRGESTLFLSKTGVLVFPHGEGVPWIGGWKVPESLSGVFSVAVRTLTQDCRDTSPMESDCGRAAYCVTIVAVSSIFLESTVALYR